MILKKFNLGLLILPVLIFSLGAATLFSTTPKLAKTQLLFFVVGMVFYFFFSYLDYAFFQYYWKYGYFLVLFLLILTFVIGEIRFGAARWLSLGLFSLQPSELSKFMLIITVAALVSSSKNYLKTFKNLLKIMLYVLPLIFLVFIQPDLGTSIISIFVVGALLFYGGLNIFYFVFALIFMGLFTAPLWEILQPYQQQRILVFLNPQLDTKGSGYNVIQSIIAVGSGGTFGRGFGRGTQSHLQFLPAYWTDFIFASFAEEWGFLGAIILYLLFALLLFTLLYIAYKIDDMFGSLIVYGITFVLFTQVLINVGMNIGIMPVTGIPLPLFSYGGSSLIVTLSMLGIVQSIWMRKKVIT